MRTSGKRKEERLRKRAHLRFIIIFVVAGDDAFLRLFDAAYTVLELLVFTAVNISVFFFVEATY